MYSRTGKPLARSAAWRISLWGALAFACGSMVVFMFLHGFVALERDDLLPGGDRLVESPLLMQRRRQIYMGFPKTRFERDSPTKGGNSLVPHPLAQ